MDAPIDLVQDRYPIGASVWLQPNFIRGACGIFKPDLSKIELAPWLVVNYYYLVGSRGKTITSVVVGTEYLNWASMAPQIGYLNAITYGQIPDNYQLSRLKYPKTSAYNTLCIVHLTDWNGQSYNEERVDALTIKDQYPGFIGDAF